MYWCLLLTLVIFFIVRKIALKIKSPLFNPFVMTVIVLIPIMLVTNTSYGEYFDQVEIIHDLLPYSVVALAYPLYELISSVI